MNHFFVYGTLKRGQCREKLWPLEPAMVRSAWTLGELYDTGPYPALVGGTDRVLGEVWSYRDDDAQTVVHVLDSIEGTNQGSKANLYDRELIEVFCLEGQAKPGESILASVYIYARLELLGTFERVWPHRSLNGMRFATWPIDDSSSQ